jgi:Tol biopolymer transport system component
MPLPRLLVLVALALLVAPATGWAHARGETVPTPTPSGGSYGTGTDVDATSDQPGIYVVHADGSGLTRLTDSSEAADWSPDGAKLAFSNGQMYVMNADGSGITRVSTGLGWYPTWSPDGTKIAFISPSDMGGTCYLVVVGADGANETTLARVSSSTEDVSWSPDGTRLAYVAAEPGPHTADCPLPPGDGGEAARTGDGTGVWVVNADGSGRTEVADLPGDASGPTWSPDGATIAFTHLVFGHDSEYQTAGVYLVNPDGSGLRALVEAPPPSNDPNEPERDDRPKPPAIWSPDGSRLAFSGDGIHIMNADGSGLTNLGAGGSDLAWAPDGQKIAFVAFAGGNPSRDLEIYVVNADGSGRVRLAGTPADDTSPAWSPDGTKVAFVAWPLSMRGN